MLEYFHDIAFNVNIILLSHLVKNFLNYIIMAPCFSPFIISSKNGHFSLRKKSIEYVFDPKMII